MMATVFNQAIFVRAVITTALFTFECSVDAPTERIVTLRLEVTPASVSAGDVDTTASAQTQTRTQESNTSTGLPIVLNS